MPEPILPKITAPFTADQVTALNAFQKAGWMHPFTCRRDHDTHQVLIADTHGWYCPDETCGYQQNWAHAFMADPDAWPSPLVGQIPVALNSPCRCGEPRVDHADDHHAACQRCPCDGFQLDWKQQILAPPEPLVPAPVPVAADGTLRQAIAEALARADGIAWERLDVGDRNSLSQDYFGSADAVLPVVEAHYAELMDEHREAHEIETENTARETERARVAEAAIEAVREWTRVEPVADAKFNEGYRAALADIAALLPKPTTPPPAG